MSLSPATRKRAEYWLWMANTLWFLSAGLLGPFFTTFYEKMGGGIFDIAWAWAIYFFVVGIFSILIGKISDGPASKARLMFWGYVLTTVFTFGYLWVDNSWKMIVDQIGLGIGAAFAYPMWEALYAQFEDHKKAGSTWGMADGSTKIVTGIGILLGGWIIAHYSFQALFIAMGVVQLFATVYIAKILGRSS